MIAWLIWLALSVGFIDGSTIDYEASLKSTTCPSSIFGFKGDALSGGVEDDETLGIAHRSLEIGTAARLQLRGRTVNVTVTDHGPYGRVLAKNSPCPKHGRVMRNGRCWVNGAIEYRICQREHPKWDPLNSRCYAKGSQWRGCVDVLPATGRALEHDGWATVTLYWVSWVVRRRRTLAQKDDGDDRSHRIAAIRPHRRPWLTTLPHLPHQRSDRT